MAFEKTQAFTLASKKVLAADQFESTVRMEVQGEKPVKKVLSVSSLPKITGKEKVGEVINFSGKTTYQVVYETEEGDLASVMGVQDFNGKLEGVQEENTHLAVKLVETTVTGNSSSEIALASLVNVYAYGVAFDKVEAVSALSEDYEKLEKTYEYQKLVNEAEDTFNEVGEESVNHVVSDILENNASVSVTSVVCGIDTVTVEGMVTVDTTYLQDNSPVSLQKEIAFRREIAALSTVPSCTADVDISLEDVKVTASVNETDAKTNFVYALELKVTSYIFAKDMGTLVQDAYSLSEDITTSYECVNAKVYQGSLTSQDTLNLASPVSENANELVLLGQLTAIVTDKKQTETAVTLSGAITGTYVYKTETGENVSDNLMLPFVTEVSGASEEDDFQVALKVLRSKLKPAKELELTVMVNVVAKNYSDQYVSYLSDIVENGAKTRNDAAIRVYVTREGEDLFSAAKAISMRPNDILAQNPELEGEFKEGTRLVVYNPLNLDF